MSAWCASQGHWFLAKDFPVAWPLLPRASLFAELRFRREIRRVHSHSPFTIGTVGALGRGTTAIFTFHTLYHRYLHYVPAPSAWTRSLCLVGAPLLLSV